MKFKISPNVFILIVLIAIIFLLFLVQNHVKEKALMNAEETKYQKGLKLFNEQFYQLASTALEEVGKESDKYEEAQSLIHKADSISATIDLANSEKYFQNGLEHYKKKEYQLAIYTLEQVIPESDKYEEAQDLVLKANKIVRKEEEKSSSKNSKKQTDNNNIYSNQSGNKFVLTHLLGEKLEKSAYFYVDGSKWKLDYNNGDKIYYTVISGNEENPLCGINSIDSNGDQCEICIIKKATKSVVQFEYAQGTLSFDGYYDKN